MSCCPTLWSGWSCCNSDAVAQVVALPNCEILLEAAVLCFKRRFLWIEIKKMAILAIAQSWASPDNAIWAAQGGDRVSVGSRESPSLGAGR